MKEIGYNTLDNPLMRNFVKYIENCPDVTEHGIRFVIPSNNNYPCNAWYLYESNTPEGNINSGIGFIFEHFASDSEIYKKAIRIAEYRMIVMSDILKSRLEATKDIWQGLEPSDYASLIYELKKHHIKTAQECCGLYNRLLDIVKKYGTSQTYEMISKQIDEIKDDHDIDLVIDKLSDNSQPWNSNGRINSVEDNAQKFAQMFNIGFLWWTIKDVINDLKLLKVYGRLELPELHETQNMK